MYQVREYYDKLLEGVTRVSLLHTATPFVDPNDDDVC